MFLSGRPYSPTEKLYLPFGMRIWTSICVLFVVGAGVVLILKMVPKKNRDFVIGNDNNMPFFNMINGMNHLSENIMF